MMSLLTILNTLYFVMRQLPFEFPLTQQHACKTQCGVCSVQKEDFASLKKIIDFNQDTNIYPMKSTPLLLNN